MKPPALNIVRAADVSSHTQEFSHPWNSLSLVRGMQLSRSAGLKRAAVNILTVPAGKESYAYHAHRFEEEWLYILAGRGVALIDGHEYDVGPGDFIGFPTPSVAHLMKNPGPADLVYLAGGENLPFEVAEFPELRKRIIRSGAELQVYDYDDNKPFGSY
jgi:uncharacterized cupin superfamily protein